MVIENQAAAIIILSVAAGLVLSPAIDQKRAVGDLFSPYSNLFDTASLEKGNKNSGLNSNFTYGTAHEHALIHIIVNGSEVDLSRERYQFQSDYVHLENNKSDIVHKHSEGVGWDDFLKTINISVEENENKLCVNYSETESCGEGKIVINGEEGFGLSEEIEQGDNLLIVVNSDDTSSIISKYMDEELPRDYKKKQFNGRKV